MVVYQSVLPICALSSLTVFRQLVECGIVIILANVLSSLRYSYNSKIKYLLFEVMSLLLYLICTTTTKNYNTKMNEK